MDFFLNNLSSPKNSFAEKQDQDFIPEVVTKNDTCVVYDNYRVGNMVRIIYKKDSIYNNYKGYIGEIKYYKKGTGYARLFLHAIQHYNVVNLPIEHFELI